MEDSHGYIHPCLLESLRDQRHQKSPERQGSHQYQEVPVIQAFHLVPRVEQGVEQQIGVDGAWGGAIRHQYTSKHGKGNSQMILGHLSDQAIP